MLFKNILKEIEAYWPKTPRIVDAIPFGIWASDKLTNALSIL
jgi:hypothetical protein